MALESTLRDALAAAGLPLASSRERQADLGASERELHRVVLRGFAHEGRVAVETVRGEAERLGLDPGAALAALARADLVHPDPEGEEITVAYPFSGLPTAHELRLPGGRGVFAMCAIDALGIPFMLDVPAEIRSRDHGSGEPIRLNVASGGEVHAEPADPVVLAGATGGSGTVASRCCIVVNFFLSADGARTYLEEHPAISGRVLTLPEAVDVGRSVFGDALV